MSGETDRERESIKDLIVLNSLKGRRQKEVGVGQRRYYVSSKLEWSILVMGHHEGGGGGMEEKKKRENERETETIVSNL